MKPAAFFLPLLLLFCTACPEPEKPAIPVGRFPDAAAYNDFIISLHDTLSVYRNDIAEALDSNQRKAVNAQIKRFRGRTLQAVDTLRALPAWQGDTSLKAAAIKLFLVYESTAGKYASLLPILYTEDTVDTTKVADSDTLHLFDTLDPNDALIPRYEFLQRRISRMEEDALEEFLLTQEAFAEKFKVKLAYKRSPRTEEE